jgi:hypothetical protein
LESSMGMELKVKRFVKELVGDFGERFERLR